MLNVARAEEEMKEKEDAVCTALFFLNHCII